LRSFYIYALAALIFWQFSEDIKKLVPCIPFSLFDLVFALGQRLENPITHYSQKKWVRAVLGKKIRGWKSVGWVNWLL